VSRAQPQPEPPRLTAQLVLSDSEAYLAYSWRRDPLGPNGELRIASILWTENGGSSWIELSWDRTWWSRLANPAFPTWPPEAISAIEHTAKGLGITHRDEWVPYEEAGGESLWRSVLSGGRWRTARLRRMDYTGIDSVDAVPEVIAQLPATMRPPALQLKVLREWGSHSNPMTLDHVREARNN
jgi:hypothetical protein